LLKFTARGRGEAARRLSVIRQYFSRIPHPLNSASWPLKTFKSYSQVLPVAGQGRYVQGIAWLRIPIR